MRRKFILTKLQQLQELPVLPDTHARLMDAIRSDMDIPAIARVAQEDPLLTMNVLRVANSVFHKGASAKPLTNLDDALVRLGVVEFEKIAISFSVLKSFSAYGDPEFLQHFWRHSMAVGHLFVRGMELLSGRAMGRKVAADLFTIGLLHDCGMIVLQHFFPKLYVRVSEAIAGTVVLDISAVERELLGVDHAEVGALLMERWGLPELYSTVVLYHHDRLAYDGKYRPFLQVLCLANQLATYSGIGNRGKYPAQAEHVKSLIGEHGGVFAPLVTYVDEVLLQTSQVLKVA